MSISNPILDRDAPVLRQVAVPVAPEEIASERIQSVIQRMKDAVHTQDDGVAIAAPQIGESLRIFVINGRLLKVIKKGVETELEEEATAEGEPEDVVIEDDLVFINPEIIKLSRKKVEMEEGCLSVRWLYGQVKRSQQATVRALDAKGQAFQLGGSGIMAQIFQHEVDHLDGILFIDKADNLVDLPPTKKHPHDTEGN